MSGSRLRTSTHAAAAIAITLQLTGCMKAEARPRFVGPVPDSVVLEEFNPPRVIHSVEVSGEELTGWERVTATDSIPVVVPVTVDEKSFSAGRTLTVLGVAVGAVVLLGLVALGSSGGFSPDFSR